YATGCSHFFSGYDESNKLYTWGKLGLVVCVFTICNDLDFRLALSSEGEKDGSNVRTDVRGSSGESYVLLIFYLYYCVYADHNVLGGKKKCYNKCILHRGREFDRISKWDGDC